jgi:hypothetical protein
VSVLRGFNQEKERRSCRRLRWKKAFKPDKSMWLIAMDKQKVKFGHDADEHPRSRLLRSRHFILDSYRLFDQPTARTACTSLSYRACARMGGAQRTRLAALSRTRIYARNH